MRVTYASTIDAVPPRAVIAKGFAMAANYTETRPHAYRICIYEPPLIFAKKLTKLEIVYQFV